MALAAEAAEDGQIVQFLAGAPDLLARYRNAPAAAAALIAAAIDARRLGMGVELPLAFRRSGSAGVPDRRRLGRSQRGLDGTGPGCTLLPSARASGARWPASVPASSETARLTGWQTYLEQHGRRERRRDIPPADFWTAALRFAAPADLSKLADAATARGLLRDAARLHKQAIALGDTSAAADFVKHWHALHPDAADPNPARWAAANASLDDPFAVAWLLHALLNAGAREAVAALLARDPAAHADLGDPHAAAFLLDALRRTSAEEQALALAERAAAHADSRTSAASPRC